MLGRRCALFHAERTRKRCHWALPDLPVTVSPLAAPDLHPLQKNCGRKCSTFLDSADHWRGPSNLRGVVRTPRFAASFYLVKMSSKCHYKLFVHVKSPNCITRSLSNGNSECFRLLSVFAIVKVSVSPSPENWLALEGRGGIP